MTKTLTVATLPEVLSSMTANIDLMHHAVVRQNANARQAIADTQNRGDSAYSSRKLFRQKGTGNARRGSRSAGTLRGGAPIHGPHAEQGNFTLNMPKRQRRQALLGALAVQGQAGLIYDFTWDSAQVSTKNCSDMVKSLSAKRLLFILGEANAGLSLSARNIPGAVVRTYDQLSVKDILMARAVLVTDGALEKALTHYAL